MPPTEQHQGENPSLRILRRGRKAFTLVEILIGAAVMTVVMFGVIGCLTFAYKLNYAIRCRDQVRAILSSFTDQFVRYNIVNPTTKDDNILFKLQSTPTGENLTWKGVSGDASGLRIWIGSAGELNTVNAGDEDNPGILVTFKCTVSHLDEDTGDANTDTSTTAAGYMLKGTFSAEYAVFGKHYKEEFVIAKSTR